MGLILGFQNFWRWLKDRKLWEGFLTTASSYVSPSTNFWFGEVDFLAQSLKLWGINVYIHLHHWKKEVLTCFLKIQISIPFSTALAGYCINLNLTKGHFTVSWCLSIKDLHYRRRSKGNVQLKLFSHLFFYNWVSAMIKTDPVLSSRVQSLHKPVANPLLGDPKGRVMAWRGTLLMEHSCTPERTVLFTSRVWDLHGLRRSSCAIPFCLQKVLLVFPLRQKAYLGKGSESF